MADEAVFTFLGTLFGLKQQQNKITKQNIKKGLNFEQTYADFCEDIFSKRLFCGIESFYSNFNPFLMFGFCNADVILSDAAPKV